MLIKLVSTFSAIGCVYPYKGAVSTMKPANSPEWMVKESNFPDIEGASFATTPCSPTTHVLLFAFQLLR